MTTHLTERLQAFDAHAVSNPDDESNLTGEEFLRNTDLTTATIVKEIRDEVTETLIAPGGTADLEAIAALRKEGVRVNVAGDPHDPNVAEIVIETLHGRLSFATIVD